MSDSQNLPVPAPETGGAPASRGRRNLLLLGAGAIVIAVITTSIELWLYRSSGDIYLDRSRPGFLPDPDDPDEEPDDNDTVYVYSDMGPITKESLQEYLKELQAERAHLQRITDPFSPTPLSNSSLGVSKIENPEPEDITDDN